MITCPFCNNLVLDVQTPGEKIRDPNTLIEDDLQDFHCPTMVDFFGMKFNHYIRTTIQGCFPEYIYYSAPFSVVWNEGEKYVRVAQWGRESSPQRNFGLDDKTVYRDKNVDWNGFVKICLRFHTLRVFS